MAAREQAANRLYQMVREFSTSTPEWGEAIRYYTKPDERFDLTLASWRVYGTGGEWMVIQAAAGLNSPEFALTERRLILPTHTQLRDMRRRAGFEDYEVI